MPTWSFLRHAESVANRAGYLAGHRDVPLTELGVQQARAARSRLREIPFHRALISDLERARHTADLVLEGRDPKVHYSHHLRERHAGSWEGARLDHLDPAATAAQLRSWTAGPPGGESIGAVARRVVRYLATHDDDVDTIVIAHGALMRAVLHALELGPAGELRPWRPTNCELVVRTVTPGAWRELDERLRTDQNRSAHDIGPSPNDSPSSDDSVSP